MRLLSSAAIILLAGSTAAFAPSQNNICRRHHRHDTSSLFMSEATATAADTESMADSGIPPAHVDSDAHVADAEIPTKLPSDVGMDYVPLATMLATGQLAEADQVRYVLEGGESKKRGGVCEETIGRSSILFGSMFC